MKLFRPIVIAVTLIAFLALGVPVPQAAAQGILRLTNGIAYVRSFSGDLAAATGATLTFLTGARIEGGGTGILTFLSTGNTNNEDLDIDLETTANVVAFSSSTGVNVLSLVEGMDLGVGTATPGAPIEIASTGSSMIQSRYSATAGSGAGLTVRRSRGATVGTDTVVVSGDHIGAFAWQGYDSVVYRSAAQISAYVDADPGSGDMPGRLVFFTTPDGSTSPTERLRIDSAGNMDFGVAGVRFSQDDDGAITFLGLGDGNDEDLTLNLDDTANTGVYTSSTGLDTLNFSSIGLTVERLSYNTLQVVVVDAATTFALTSSYIDLACTGAESIDTITGGVLGQILIIQHDDTDCTLNDDDDVTAADALDLAGATTNITGAASKTISLIYDGTAWRQTGGITG